MKYSETVSRGSKELVLSVSKIESDCVVRGYGRWKGTVCNPKRWKIITCLLG